MESYDSYQVIPEGLTRGIVKLALADLYVSMRRIHNRVENEFTVTIDTEGVLFNSPDTDAIPSQIRVNLEGRTVFVFITSHFDYTRGGDNKQCRDQPESTL